MCYFCFVNLEQTSLVNNGNGNRLENHSNKIDYEIKFTLLVIIVGEAHHCVVVTAKSFQTQVFLL